MRLLSSEMMPDEHGFGTTTLEPVSAPVWAYFRQLSGKEVFAAATTNYKEEVLFTVNYNPEITNNEYPRYTVQRRIVRYNAGRYV